MNTSDQRNDDSQNGADTLEIRFARASDVPNITRLLWDDEQGRQRESLSAQDAFNYASAFERIERDSNSQLFVATSDDAVIGCLQLTVIPGLSYRGVSRALVEDVRVDRSYRGQGIGERLLSHSEAHAIGLGCGLMELFVHGERNDAHRFYEREGYVGAHRGFRKVLAPV
jgi:GNAT superfamily N-acetyltransferase